MARKASSEMNMTGIGLILLGLVMIAAPFFLPLSVAGWLGGDAAVTFVVYSRIAPSGEDQKDYRAQGANCWLQKTVDSQMNPVDVWGDPPPTGTDMYGIMTFYCSLGVHYWKVEYDGKRVDGYVELFEERDNPDIYVYMNDGVASYNPDSAEYVEEEPEPEPPEVPVVSVITVVVDTEPVKGYLIALHGTTGDTLGEGTAPVQFTHEGHFPVTVVFHDVEGYDRPSNYEGVVSSDTRITGTYVESGEAEEPEATEDPLETEDVIITESEEEALETMVEDYTDPEGTTQSIQDTKVKMIKDFKSPVYMALQVLGGSLFFIGFVMTLSPIVKR